MKRIATLALGATLLAGSLTAKAAYPEHVCLIGEACPSYWLIDSAVEMTNEGDGNYSWTGPLWLGLMKFTAGHSWDCPQYHACGYGAWLVNASKEPCFVWNPGDEGDNPFWVAENGTYEIKLHVNEANTDVKIEARWIDDLPTMCGALGAATNQWDCKFNAPLYYAEEGSTDIEMYFDIVPNADKKHLKLINCPGNGFETLFYVPTEVDYNGNVKLVKHGETYPVQLFFGDSQPVCDHFWGFEDDDCEPTKVTFDTANFTIKFEKWDKSGVEAVSAADVKVSFNGDVLNVMGADSAQVYDLSGRLVASGNGSTVAASGVYIVKAGNKVIKIAK